MKSIFLPFKLALRDLRHPEKELVQMEVHSPNQQILYFHPNAATFPFKVTKRSNMLSFTLRKWYQESPILYGNQTDFQWVKEAG